MTVSPRADLHLHTNQSDGSYEPREIVRLADDLRFDAIAITDHDSVGAVEDALCEGKRLGVRVIPGVELSTFYGEAETHMVGLFVDHRNAGLIRLTDRAACERQKRLFLIAERLREVGVDIEAEDVLDGAAGAAVGRVHLAEALVRSGATSSISESFYRYLGVNRPAYVAKWMPTPEECIRVIREAGGVAVLAHPGEAIDEQKCAKFVAMGCRALEGYYPTYSRSVTETYTKLAARLGVGVAGGSDCHGSRKDRPLFGSVSLPLELVDDLERRRG